MDENKKPITNNVIRIDLVSDANDDMEKPLAVKAQHLVHLRQKAMSDFFAVSGVKVKRPKFHHANISSTIPCKFDTFKYPTRLGYSLIDGFGINRNAAIEELVRHNATVYRLSEALAFFPDSD